MEQEGDRRGTRFSRALRLTVTLRFVPRRDVLRHFFYFGATKAFHIRCASRFASRFVSIFGPNSHHNFCGGGKKFLLSLAISSVEGEKIAVRKNAIPSPVYSV
eukprot:g5022.t1